MQEKEIFRKVGEVIKELNKQYEHLSKSQGKYSDLEIELFVANANFLADHIKIIQKLNGIQKRDVKEAEPDIPEVKSVQEEIKQEEINEDNAEEEVEPVKDQVPESDTAELKFEFEAQEPEEEEEVKAEEKEPEQKESQEEEEMIVKQVVIREKTVSVDIPAEQLPTVNDLLSSDQPTIAGKYIRQPVADLKSIINLNDKLLFVKDLFNGYNLAYSEAIDLLNRFDSFEAADNFLKKNYALKNSWSEKQATVDKFYVILNRRFTK